MAKVVIDNVDKSFFDRNGVTAGEVVRLLEGLPVPPYVTAIVLDGNTTGKQTGPVVTNKHPMIFALNREERKQAVFLSSTGRKTRNVGAKRVLVAALEGSPESVLANPFVPRLPGLPDVWES